MRKETLDLLQDLLPEEFYSRLSKTAADSYGKGDPMAAPSFDAPKKAAPKKKRLSSMTQPAKNTTGIKDDPSARERALTTAKSGVETAQKMDAPADPNATRMIGNKPYELNKEQTRYTRTDVPKHLQAGSRQIPVDSAEAGGRKRAPLQKAEPKVDPTKPRFSATDIATRAKRHGKALAGLPAGKATGAVGADFYERAPEGSGIVSGKGDKAVLRKASDRERFQVGERSYMSTPGLALARLGGKIDNDELEKAYNAPRTVAATLKQVGDAADLTMAGAAAKGVGGLVPKALRKRVASAAKNVRPGANVKAVGGSEAEGLRAGLKPNQAKKFADDAAKGPPSYKSDPYYPPGHPKAKTPPGKAGKPGVKKTPDPKTTTPPVEVPAKPPIDKATRKAAFREKANLREVYEQDMRSRFATADDAGRSQLKKDWQKFKDTGQVPEGFKAPATKPAERMGGVDEGMARELGTWREPAPAAEGGTFAKTPDPAVTTPPQPSPSTPVEPLPSTRPQVSVAGDGKSAVYRPKTPGAVEPVAPVQPAPAPAQPVATQPVAAPVQPGAGATEAYAARPTPAVTQPPVQTPPAGQNTLLHGQPSTGTGAGVAEVSTPPKVIPNPAARAREAEIAEKIRVAQEAQASAARAAAPTVAEGPAARAAPSADSFASTPTPAVTAPPVNQNPPAKVFIKGGPGAGSATPAAEGSSRLRIVDSPARNSGGGPRLKLPDVPRQVPGGGPYQLPVGDGGPGVGAARDRLQVMGKIGDDLGLNSKSVAKMPQVEQGVHSANNVLKMKDKDLVQKFVDMGQTPGGAKMSAQNAKKAASRVMQDYKASGGDAKKLLKEVELSKPLKERWGPGARKWTRRGILGSIGVTLPTLAYQQFKDKSDQTQRVKARTPPASDAGMELSDKRDTPHDPMESVITAKGGVPVEKYTPATGKTTKLEGSAAGGDVSQKVMKERLFERANGGLTMEQINAASPEDVTKKYQEVFPAKEQSGSASEATPKGGGEVSTADMYKLIAKASNGEWTAEKLKTQDPEVVKDAYQRALKAQGGN